MNNQKETYTPSEEPTARELAEQMETNALRSYARRLFQVQLLLDTVSSNISTRNMERLPVTGRQGMLVQLAAELVKGVEEALKQAADRRE